MRSITSWAAGSAARPATDRFGIAASTQSLASKRSVIGETAGGDVHELTTVHHLVAGNVHVTNQSAVGAPYQLQHRVGAPGDPLDSRAVVDDQVGRLANLDRADLIVDIQRFGTANRERFGSLTQTAAPSGLASAEN